ARSRVVVGLGEVVVVGLGGVVVVSLGGEVAGRGIGEIDLASRTRLGGKGVQGGVQRHGAVRSVRVPPARAAAGRGAWRRKTRGCRGRLACMGAARFRRRSAPPYGEGSRAPGAPAGHWGAGLVRTGVPHDYFMYQSSSRVAACEPSDSSASATTAAAPRRAGSAPARCSTTRSTSPSARTSSA